jgi:uncharacterized protein YjiK
MVYLTLSLIFFSHFACIQSDRSDSHLGLYFSDIKRYQIELDKDLREISGLTLTQDGNLLAHHDEEGEIYQIDHTSGQILKKFKIGRKKVKADFEGIASTMDYLYMTTSSGDLYQFREGKDGEKVKFEVFDTPLSSKNNVEGLCFNPDSNSLLLACKDNPGKGIKDKRAVYQFSLQEMQLQDVPFLLIPEEGYDKSDSYSLIRKIGSFFLLPTRRKFSPSAICRHPQSGHFFILSANDPMLVEVSASGDLLGSVELDQEKHVQPEGITFLTDLSLIIVDEGAGGPAHLTCYKPNLNPVE